MNQLAIVLRHADPIYDDGLAFAHYLNEAFEGLIRKALGRRFKDIIAKAFIQSGHDFSYQHTIFAERDKAVVGMVTGYTAEQHRRASDQELKTAAGNHISSRIGASLLCIRLRYLGTHADGDFYLQAIAVDEGHRGKGIGSVLMEAIEERARSSGSRRLFLDAAARNERVRRFYERRGMTVESEWFSSPIMPTFIVHMTKLL